MDRAYARHLQRGLDQRWFENPSLRKLYLPTWRQLVELNLLREEAERLTGR
jgi:hypothetical protein